MAAAKLQVFFLFQAKIKPAAGQFTPQKLAILESQAQELILGVLFMVEIPVEELLRLVALLVWAQQQPIAELMVLIQQSAIKVKLELVLQSVQDWGRFT